MLYLILKQASLPSGSSVLNVTSKSPKLKKVPKEPTKELGSLKSGKFNKALTTSTGPELILNGHVQSIP